MPTLGRPDVDALEGLTTAIIVDQERMGANACSTVGTVTDANAMLRVLWSRQAAHRTRDRFLVQRPDAQGKRRDERRQGRGERIVVRDVVYFGGVPEVRGWGRSTTSTCRSSMTRANRLNEGALTILVHGRWLAGAHPGRRGSIRTSRSGNSNRRSTTSSTASRRR